MGFKPSDFFIGIIDFFSVLLPGALVTYFLINPLYAPLFNGKIFPVLTSDAEKWIVFLFSAYMTGNIIFGLSSLLDKIAYNRLIRKVFTRNFDLSYKTATAIRNQFIPVNEWITEFRKSNLLTDHEFERLASNNRREIINTYKWAQCLLESVQPRSLNDIRRAEADSKFFRSLVVALCAIGIYLLFQNHITIGIIALALSAASLYRYGDLRYKSTERAYEQVIALVHRKRNKGQADTAAVATLDNRSILKASAKVEAKYKLLITHLLPTENTTANLIDISKSKTWSTGRMQQDERIYCVNGKTILSDNNNDKIFISPGALFQLKKGSSYEIQNSQDESLVLLSVN